jgi:multidrug efflux system outer membrane protein
MPIPPYLFRSAPAARLVLSAGALLALSACATPASTTAASAAPATPTAWQNTAAPAAPRDPATLAAWWHQFNDPVLDDLIARALQTSPSVRTAIAKVTESRARYGVQRASLLPSLSASASGRGTSTENHGTDTTARTESYSASLDASWEIDLFGQNRQTLNATAADLAQTEENLRDAQASLAAEVATAYVSLRSAEAQLASVEASLRSREETAQLTQWREQAGTGSTLETQQALTSLEQARASVPTLQATITQARNQLAILAGQTPGALDTLLATAQPVPAAATTLATGIPAETLAQRPDVRAAARAAEAAAARTSAARRDRFPTLTLTGSIGVDALQAGKLFSPSSTVASALGSLTAPIFAAGRIQQTIKIQDALQQQALIAYESTVLSALADVENALVSVQRNTERLASLDRAVTSAREAAGLARLQYQAGQADLLTVLDAERTQLSLEQQLVVTTADRTTAHIQLYKALGGGWTRQS